LRNLFIFEDYCFVIKFSTSSSDILRYSIYESPQPATLMNIIFKL
jgi:hypothetical protein